MPGSKGEVAAGGIRSGVADDPLRVLIRVVAMGGLEPHYEPVLSELHRYALNN